MAPKAKPDAPANKQSSPKQSENVTAYELPPRPPRTATRAERLDWLQTVAGMLADHYPETLRLHRAALEHRAALKSPRYAERHRPSAEVLRDAQYMLMEYWALLRGLHHAVFPLYRETAALFDGEFLARCEPVKSMHAVEKDMDAATQTWRDIAAHAVVAYEKCKDAQAGRADGEDGAATRLSEGGQEKPDTPETNPNLIYQCDGAEFYNIPKSTLCKAARRSPGTVGYLWSDTRGSRRFYRKSDLEKLARSRQKLRGS